MTQITLTPELEKAIEERAKAKGTTTEALALDGLRGRFLPPVKSADPKEYQIAGRFPGGAHWCYRQQ